MVNIALIGYGYWGPNILRNLLKISTIHVSWVIDTNKKVITDIPRVHPHIKIASESQKVMNDAGIDAVIIATPPLTHFTLAKEALLKNKHVLVEKPITSTISEALTLITLARKQKKTLMVDHTFLYTPAIIELKRILTSGIIGTVLSVDSVRTNLGIFQKDTNVVSDLAIHDFAIMDYLFGSPIESIAATGLKDSSLKQETVAYISARYKNRVFLHTHVSWLSPVKIRRMLIVGTKKMIMYDDIEPSEKIKIYDKSVLVARDPKNNYALRVGYRSGAVHIPHIAIGEGLTAMVDEFVKSVKSGITPRSDGIQGLQVVRAVLAATASMRGGGKVIKRL